MTVTKARSKGKISGDLEVACIPGFVDGEIRPGCLVATVEASDTVFQKHDNGAAVHENSPVYLYVGRLFNFYTTTNVQFPGIKDYKTVLSQHIELKFKDKDGWYYGVKPGGEVTSHNEPQLPSDTFVLDLYRQIPDLMEPLGIRKIEALRLAYRVLPLDLYGSITTASR